VTTRPSFEEVTRPALERFARCADIVFAGVFVLAAISPADRPAGCSPARMVKTLKRVGCARALIICMAAVFSIPLE
jgi:hypothetical protein